MMTPLQKEKFLTRRRQDAKKKICFKKKTKPKGVSMDFLEVELKILCGCAPLR